MYYPIMVISRTDSDSNTRSRASRLGEPSFAREQILCAALRKQSGFLLAHTVTQILGLVLATSGSRRSLYPSELL